MLDFLRDGAWQGVGVVVAVFATLIGGYLTRRSKPWLYSIGISGVLVIIILLAAEFRERTITEQNLQGTITALQSQAAEQSTAVAKTVLVGASQVATPVAAPPIIAVTQIVNTQVVVTQVAITQVPVTQVVAAVTQIAVTQIVSNSVPIMATATTSPTVNAQLEPQLLKVDTVRTSSSNLSDPKVLIDGDPSKWWRANQKPAGAEITFLFREPKTIKRIGIYSSDDTFWARLGKAIVISSDKQQNIELKDFGGWQYFDIEPTTTDSIVIKGISGYNGEVSSDLVICEVELLGN